MDPQASSHDAWLRGWLVNLTCAPLGVGGGYRESFNPVVLNICQTDRAINTKLSVPSERSPLHLSVNNNFVPSIGWQEMTTDRVTSCSGDFDANYGATRLVSETQF